MTGPKTIENINIFLEGALSIVIYSVWRRCVYLDPQFTRFFFVAVILCNLHYFLDVAQVSPNSGSFIIWFLLYPGDDVVIISRFLHVFFIGCITSAISRDIPVELASRQGPVKRERPLH